MNQVPELRSPGIYTNCLDANPRHQLSFEDFLPFVGKLSGGNRWIKLAELIPWDELEDDY